MENQPTDGLTDRRRDEPTIGQMNRPADRRTDGQIDKPIATGRVQFTLQKTQDIHKQELLCKRGQDEERGPREIGMGARAGCRYIDSLALFTPLPYGKRLLSGLSIIELDQKRQ